MAQGGKLLIIAPLLGAILIAAGAYLVAPRLMGGNVAASQASSGGETPAIPGPMYVLKERVVNLADTGARRYLKIAGSLEFGVGAEDFRRLSAEERQQEQAEFDKTIAQFIPLIDDAIITLISAHTSADLATVEGKERLKNEIKDGVNMRLGGDRVSEIYFTQFVMQ